MQYHEPTLVRVFTRWIRDASHMPDARRYFTQRIRRDPTYRPWLDREWPIVGVRYGESELVQRAWCTTAERMGVSDD